jgi:hypothetical protein
MSLRSRHILSRLALDGTSRRNLRWAATFALLSVGQLQADLARATIQVGSTTVSSIGHSFEPADDDPIFGHPAFVTDFLVNQTHEVGGGALLPSVTVNLDLDTSIAYTIAAPVGYKFSINVPAGTAASMFLDLEWVTGVNDSATSLGMSDSFTNLIGTAPSFPNSSTVGANDQVFRFESASGQFSSSISFTSVTFTVNYTQRALGQGPLTYQPTGSAQAFGTSASNANFIVGYNTTGAVDPGRFVSLVPFVLGDYNQNGVVDAADYTVWRDTLFQNGPGLAADGNQDRVVNQLDYQIWIDHFPKLSGAAAVNTVPEPATLSLLLAGILMMCSRRRLLVSSTHGPVRPAIKGPLIAMAVRQVRMLGLLLALRSCGRSRPSPGSWPPGPFGFLVGVPW